MFNIDLDIETEENLISKPEEIERHFTFLQASRPWVSFLFMAVMSRAVTMPVPDRDHKLTSSHVEPSVGEDGMFNQFIMLFIFITANKQN